MYSPRHITRLQSRVIDFGYNLDATTAETRFIFWKEKLRERLSTVFFSRCLLNKFRYFRKGIVKRHFNLTASSSFLKRRCTFDPVQYF